MKSLFSLLFALFVLLLIIAGAYVVSQGGTTQAGRWIGLRPAGSPTLELANETRFSLTVTLRGPGAAQFALAPGKTDKKTLKAGAYDVEGHISDSSTESFHAQWTFEDGRAYQAGFRRDGETGLKALMVLPLP